MFFRQFEMILYYQDNMKNKTRENLWKFLKICLFWKQKKKEQNQRESQENISE